MNNYIVESYSRVKSSGFFYKINTKLNHVYSIKLNIKLIKGDKCFLYCEDDLQKRYIDRNKNIYYLDEKKNLEHEIIGTGKLLKIGILFWQENIEYVLKVYSFDITEKEKILNNIKNLVLYKGASIKTKTLLSNDSSNNTKKIILSSFNKFNSSEFNKRGILQVYISLSLKHFDRIKNIYNLVDYNNHDEPLLIYGVYDAQDYNIVKNHKGSKYIIWGGSDIDDRIKSSIHIANKIKQLKNIYHFAISESLEHRIQKMGFNCERINFNLADPKIFKPVHNLNANNIYIYNGFTAGKEWIYGKEIYQEVMKRIPEFNYILSNKTKVSHHEMPHIYSQCFIALRLTLNDGNANTAQELDLMQIPLVHNGECNNCIHWNTVDDVELEIRYRNIYLFNENIKKYKKILFVNDDYSSNYEMETNTYKMINWYEKNGHETFGIFINAKKSNTECNNVDKNIICSTILTKSNLNKCFEYFSGYPDLIIFRGPIAPDLFKDIKCPKYIFVSELFLNVPDKHFNELCNDEINMYINKNIIELCKNMDNIYVSNMRTFIVLKKYFNIIAYPLYFNYIPYYKSKINVDPNFGNRQYEYGIIQSNFNKKINHIDNIINKLIPLKEKVILIGGYSDQYEHLGFTCKILTNNNVTKYTKKIKYIIQNNTCDLNNNIMIEARFSGCKIINDISEINLSILKEPPTVNRKNKILISSTQYPGYGGAATNAYKLIIFLRKIGYKCIGLFITDSNVNCDPENIGDVFLYQCSDYKFNNSKKDNELKKKIIKSLGGEPDICFGKNYIAPYYNKILFNKSIHIYLVSGISYPISNERSIPTYFNKIKNNEKFNYMQSEIKTLEACNFAVCNSPLLLDTFKTIYDKKYSNKIFSQVIDTTKYDVNYDEIKKNYSKKFDIILVCSSFTRKDKNYSFIADILRNSCFDKFKKCAVGNNNYIFRDIKNMTFYDLQTNIKAKKLIKKSRLLLLPSLFEANSNVMREAINNNCIVLSSKNVGWSENLPAQLVCTTYDHNEWKNKIFDILNNYDKYSDIKINIVGGLELDIFIHQLLNK